jgi:DNA-binding response OmpR family regulator
VSERQQTILVVDDEPALIEILERYLCDDGFAVLRATDGRAAIDVAVERRPDLILLDLNLPKVSGLDAFREIRRAYDVPIIMVSARGDEVDRVVGLELGADDYIAKPCSPREVVARVKTVLRRHGAGNETALRRGPHDVRRLGDLTIDVAGRDVSRNGASIKLTPTEFRLLCTFADHPGRVFTRDHLIALIAVGGGEVFDRTLDRHVANLRAKIEVDAQYPRYILTVYGVGYKLVDLPPN